MFRQSLFIAVVLSSLILLIPLGYLRSSSSSVNNCIGQNCRLVNEKASDFLGYKAAGARRKDKISQESSTPVSSNAVILNQSHGPQSRDETGSKRILSNPKEFSLPHSTTSSNSSTTSSTTKSPSRDAQSTNITAKPLILFYNRIDARPYWWFTGTEKDFANCPNQCRVTGDISLFSKADLVLFQTPRFMSRKGDQIKLTYFRTEGIWPTERGNPGQVRMFYAREPETAVLSGEGLSFARYMFNYTITFQQNADIFYPYGHTIKQPSALKISEVMKHKKRLIFWMVSNCGSRKRMEYKTELEKYVQVDMIGRCNKTHGDPCDRVYSCIMALKRQYKFYLAFENSMCQEYITEKFWKALNEGMVPIVMGAPKKTYERVSPPNSFIHVQDFLSPQHLSKYLLTLDKNDTLYRKYHKWRETHAIQYNSANCDICRFATEKPPKVTDITQAWDAKTQCIWP